jgi:hypothetical protein
MMVKYGKELDFAPAASPSVGRQFWRFTAADETFLAHFSARFVCRHG